MMSDIPRPAERPTGFGGGRFAGGLAGFAALTVGSLALLFAFTLRANLAEVVKDLSICFLLLALLGAAADLLIGATRYQIFLRRIRPGTSLWLPLRADLANRFTGAVTPSQTGGGPAQLFILFNGGIPVPDALSFMTINFVSTLIFFLLSGGFTAWALRDQFSQSAIQYLVEWGFVAFLGALILMIIALVRPDLLVRPINWVVQRTEGNPRAWAKLMSKAGRFLVENADRFQKTSSHFLRDAPWLLVGSFLVTVILYLNKFTLAWFVLRGLGIQGDYVTTLAVQALLQFILYVAPTPGGAGIAELSTGALMTILLPTHLLGPFTLAFRFFLLYLPAAAGGFVLAHALRTRPAARAPAGKVAPSLLVLVLFSLSWLPTPLTAQSRPLEVVLASRTNPLPAPLSDITLAPSLSQRDRLNVERLIIRSLSAPRDEASLRHASEAVTISRKMVEATPNDPDSHTLLAIALGLELELRGGRTKLRLAAEVRSEAETALALDPYNPGAHHVLGRLHAAAMRMNPIKRFAARKILGGSALDGVSWELAEYHFRQARMYEPDSPRHAMELGALYIDTDRPRLARSILEEAVALSGEETRDRPAVERARALLAGLPSDGQSLNRSG